MMAAVVRDAIAQAVLLDLDLEEVGMHEGDVGRRAPGGDSGFRGFDHGDAFDVGLHGFGVPW
jgi:hypothetical protein